MKKHLYLCAGSMVVALASGCASRVGSAAASCNSVAAIRESSTKATTMAEATVSAQRSDSAAMVVTMLRGELKRIDDRFSMAYSNAHNNVPAGAGSDLRHDLEHMARFHRYYVTLSERAFAALETTNAVGRPASPPDEACGTTNETRAAEPGVGR